MSMSQNDVIDPQLPGNILGNLNTAVLLFDDALELRYINPAGELLFAISANAVLGKYAAGLVPCPDESIEQRLRDALETRQPFTEREVEMQRPDGQCIRVNCTVMPVQDPSDGQLQLLMELHQVDRQLRIHREEQLLSQHQATQELLRGLAHEIKNPLGGLRGAAQLLERELPNEELCEYTRIIIDEADRLQGLLNRMLGPNQLPRQETVNIHHVLEHVRNLLAAEFPSGPKIERDYDPSIPQLEGDPDRLIQAVLNIARNGAQAAGSSGHLMLRTRVLRRFTIGNRLHRLVVCVDVEDSGPGIPDHMIERIFFPMVTGRSTGTGLGLSIAQELINQHAGLIECESRPGETHFLVYLPLNEELAQLGATHE